MDDDQIKAARALCEAATSGPWSAEDGTADRAPTINGPARPGVAGFPVPMRVASNQDAAFIAAARTLLPAALDEIEKARTTSAAEAAVRMVLESEVHRSRIAALEVTVREQGEAITKLRASLDTLWHRFLHGDRGLT